MWAAPVAVATMCTSGALRDTPRGVRLVVPGSVVHGSSTQVAGVHRVHVSLTCGLPVWPYVRAYADRNSTRIGMNTRIGNEHVDSLLIPSGRITYPRRRNLPSVHKPSAPLQGIDRAAIIQVLAERFF